MFVFVGYFVVVFYLGYYVYCGEVCYLDYFGFFYGGYLGVDGQFDFFWVVVGIGKIEGNRLERGIVVGVFWVGFFCFCLRFDGVGFGLCVGWIGCVGIFFDFGVCVIY